MMNKLAFILLGYLGLSIAYASVSYSDRAAQLIEQSINKHYGELVAVTGQFSTDATLFCQNKSAIEHVQARFHAVMDAWQRVQWLRYGPSQVLARSLRMQIWPDKHGVVSRQLRKIMREQDIDQITGERFITGSVALQGLPALEKLLFANQEIWSQESDHSLSFRCQYLFALAENIHLIASELESDWQGSYGQAVVAADQPNDYFVDASEAQTQLFAELVNQIEFIKDKKIKQPLDLAGQPPKPALHKLESRLSSRSLKNISINVVQLKQVYDLMFAPQITSAILKAEVDVLWLNIIKQLQILPESIVEASQLQPEALAQLAQQLDMLHQRLIQQVATDLDIVVGFNSLDGD